MGYSIEPKDKIYVKGFSIFILCKEFGRNLSNKYSQKFFETTKELATDNLNTP